MEVATQGAGEVEEETLLMTCQLLLMVVGGSALRRTSLMTGHADRSAIRDETRSIRRASTQKPD